MAQKKAETLPMTKRQMVYKPWGPILKYFGSKMPKFIISPGDIH